MMRDGLHINADGSKRWYLNDQWHRTDGPAVEHVSGNKYWFLNGKRHREDGPAIERVGGDKEWFSNGKRHRADGPAIVWSDGDKEWWLTDHHYSLNEWLAANTNISDQQRVMFKLEHA
jgi:hypothetical protein